MGLGVMMAQKHGPGGRQSQAAGAAAGSRRRSPAPVAYFVAVDGKQVGPFGMAELQAQCSRPPHAREPGVGQGMAAWAPPAGVGALREPVSGDAAAVAAQAVRGAAAIRHRP